MATTPPSPPATPAASAHDSLPSSDLATQLDALLESYLSLLDAYTTLRTQLSSEFASGFLSLAHANRNAVSVLGAGRRFGQDGYDERMKAIRGVRIEHIRRRDMRKQVQTEREPASEDNKQSSKKTETEHATDRETAELKHQVELDADDGSNGLEQEDRRDDYPCPEAATTKDSQILGPDPKEADTVALADIDAEHYQFSATDDTPSGTTETKPRDPLLCFTALPPQALRQTQSHFTSTVHTTIPELLTTISKMETLEKQIWDVRGELGILDQYQLVPAEHAEDTDKDERISNQTKTAGGKDVHEKQIADLKTASAAPATNVKESKESSTPTSPSKRQSLVSRARPSEPRSRVLKMD